MRLEFRYYKIDKELISYLRTLNERRNELHFLTGLNFEISNAMISDLKKLNIFVQETVDRFMNFIKRE